MKSFIRYPLRDSAISLELVKSDSFEKALARTLEATYLKKIEQSLLVPS
jgi:hypothetical protein